MKVDIFSLSKIVHGHFWSLLMSDHHYLLVKHLTKYICCIPYSYLQGKNKLHLTFHMKIMRIPINPNIWWWPSCCWLSNLLKHPNMWTIYAMGLNVWFCLTVIISARIYLNFPTCKHLKKITFLSISARADARL